ncbi:hypothetical protein [Phascolarctobacterium succinatutens]|uniref:hypothetical protein n=1 Tax=Phascolarctobacterium succinatutens TaxID=626940 RepID=UPI0026F0ACA3|nr:hypothetical protein [Phascolarctobacterium succinatutens]
MSEKAMFYCFVFMFGAYDGTGYMGIVKGIIAVATVKFLSYLYRSIDNLYLFILSLISFVFIIKVVSPIAYFTVWSSTAFYVLFVLFAIFKGKTSDDTKHMSVTELYLELRDEIFKQKQQ